MNFSLDALLGLLKALVRPIMDFLIYMAGRRAGVTEQEGEQAKKDAELAQEYASIASEPRDPSDEPRRMREGEW